MDGIESWLARAAGLHNAGRPDLAEHLAVRAGKIAGGPGLPDRALQLVPANTAATGLKARILLEQGSPARAEALAREALAIDPEDVSPRETLAWPRLQNSRSAAAAPKRS